METKSSNITNSGTLTITGVPTFKVVNGASISVGSANNNFVATPVFTATSGTIADVTIVDNSALAFVALTLTGNLTATVTDGTDTVSYTHLTLPTKRIV